MIFKTVCTLFFSLAFCYTVATAQKPQTAHLRTPKKSETEPKAKVVVEPPRNIRVSHKDSSFRFSGYIELTWTRALSIEVEIQRKRKGDKSNGFETIPSHLGKYHSEVPFQDRSIPDFEEYLYRLRSVNKSGQTSEWTTPKVGSRVPTATEGKEEDLPKLSGCLQLNSAKQLTDITFEAQFDIPNNCMTAKDTIHVILFVSKNDALDKTDILIQEMDFTEGEALKISGTSPKPLPSARYLILKIKRGAMSTEQAQLIERQ